MAENNSKQAAKEGIGKGLCSAVDLQGLMMMMMIYI